MWKVQTSAVRIKAAPLEIYPPCSHGYRAPRKLPCDFLAPAVTVPETSSKFLIISGGGLKVDLTETPCQSFSSVRLRCALKCASARAGNSPGAGIWPAREHAALDAGEGLGQPGRGGGPGTAVGRVEGEGVGTVPPPPAARAEVSEPRHVP